eukprot:731913-Hanusia_phi.AAC.1
MASTAKQHSDVHLVGGGEEASARQADRVPLHVLAPLPPIQQLVGKDVRPFVGLHVVMASGWKHRGSKEVGKVRREEKRREEEKRRHEEKSVREMTCMQIDKVFAEEKQCLVRWKFCPPQEDKLMMCNIGKDNEFWLARQTTAP